MRAEPTIQVRATDLRLWRDTLRAEKTAVADGEDPLLHTPWTDTGVSLADRMIAAMESYLIATDTDWPDEQENAC